MKSNIHMKNMMNRKSTLQLSAKQYLPDSKVHGANMEPIWVLSARDGPHVGLMNLAIWATCSNGLENHGEFALEFAVQT